jgi:hypothetical protein
MHNAVYEIYTSLSPVGAMVPSYRKVRIIWLLQLTYCRFKSFGMLRHVDWQVTADVSKDPNVLRFNLRRIGLLDPENANNTFLQKSVICLQNDTVYLTHPSFLEGTKPDTTHFIFLELEFNLIRRNYSVFVSCSALTIM